MLTLDQVRHETRDLGVDITPRTFWRYVELGLLPEGMRFAGQGNIFFFPEDTPQRIAQIQTLKQELGIPIHLIQKSLLYLLEDEPWSKTVIRKPPSARDLVVWLAGVMANMHLVHKPSLERGDLTALLERLKTLFEKLGVREPSTSSQLREAQHVETPQLRDNKYEK